MTITYANDCTYIEDGDRTYAIPLQPKQCGLCGCMSGVFVNRLGETRCGRCQKEVAP